MSTMPELTDPPIPPSRADSANFSARADAFLGWFTTAWENLREVVSFVGTAMTSAETNASAASTSAAAADQAKDQSVAAKTASEMARDQSVAAKTASETARDQSIAAKTTSETARDQSVTAKTASETARDQSVAAETASETAKAQSVEAKTASETARDQSVASATEAAASAITAASYAQKWVSGTSYTEGQLVWSPVDKQSYRRKTDGAGTKDPSADSANWVRIGSVPNDASVTREKIAPGFVLPEARVALGSGTAIDCLAGNYFTRTISAATTFSVSNVPAAGTAAAFLLDLTNGGSAIITWWSGVKWASGTAPTLTAAGRDVLGFFSHDGGTTWTGLVLGRDVK